MPPACSPAAAADIELGAIITFLWPGALRGSLPAAAVEIAKGLTRKVGRAGVVVVCQCVWVSVCVYVRERLGGVAVVPHSENTESVALHYLHNATSDLVFRCLAKPTGSGH